MDMLRLLKEEPRAASTLEATKVLLGEGTHDGHFFQALLRDLAITDVQTGSYGGSELENALNALRVMPRARDRDIGPLRVLGVTTDADTDRDAAFRRVCGALGRAKYDVPDKPGEFTDGELRVAVFIMPDNESDGTMETLCLRTVEKDPAMVCVDGYFECIRQGSAHQPSAGKLDKARAHAFLASQEQPDLHCGLAAREGYWNFGSPALKPLKEFITNLARGS